MTTRWADADSSSDESEDRNNGFVAGRATVPLDRAPLNDRTLIATTAKKVGSLFLNNSLFSSTLNREMSHDNRVLCLIFRATSRWLQTQKQVVGSVVFLGTAIAMKKMKPT